ncbi:peptidoglycan DD-metalloendopeptidase family protein [Dechloromonas sp. ZY10]|uniref:murein hydrolase activator EnvC family protein n=1 Tax=Dechloromonas aquae TaxID=2664436 RepID=UPI003529542D
MPPPLSRPSPRLLFARRALAGTCCLLTLAGLPAAANPPAKGPQGKAPPPEIAEKQADLGELRGRIENLRKELSASEESKASAADRLRESERQISRLEREVHELGEQRGQLQKKLKNLEQQSTELGQTLAQQQNRLERLLYRHYLRGNPDTLQSLLNGEDPNQLARDLYYFSAIAQARSELMGELKDNLARKKALASETKARAGELAEIEAEQQKRHSELQKQREQRKTLYAQLAEKVNAQRKEIGSLQQNEKRLTQLIDRLSKILAAQAAARAAEAAKAAESARRASEEASRHKKRGEEPPARTTSEAPRSSKPAEAENRYEPAPNDGSFARQKGNLRLPVRGSVSGRFGSPREGGGTWRGLFIRATSGSEVKAVANGRVVFADWMRGFGNLLIVDHGDGYLSIYGNNEALLKQVGQSVRGGENIASVGNSGGNPESGLYFEIRHQGQPVDPMKWASLK